MAKWEYAELPIQLYDKHLVQTLNQWGAAEWEIVQIVVPSTTAIGSTDWVRIIFKRPKP